MAAAVIDPSDVRFQAAATLLLLVFLLPGCVSNPPEPPARINAEARSFVLPSVSSGEMVVWELRFREPATIDIKAGVFRQDAGPSGSWGVGDSCGEMAFKISGQEPKTFRTRWGEARGHLFLSRGLVAEDVMHPWAPDTLVIPVAEHAELDDVQVPANESILVMAGHSQVGDIKHSLTFEVTNATAPFEIKGLGLYRLWCSTTWGDFNGDLLVYSGSPGAPFVVARNVGSEMTAANGTEISMWLLFHPGIPNNPVEGGRCSIRLEVNGAVEEQNKSTGSCQVQYEGPPSRVRWVIEEAEGYSPYISRFLVDMPREVRDQLRADG